MSALEIKLTRWLEKVVIQDCDLLGEKKPLTISNQWISLGKGPYPPQTELNESMGQPTYVWTLCVWEQQRDKPCQDWPKGALSPRLLRDQMNRQKCRDLKASREGDSGENSGMSSSHMLPFLFRKGKTCHVWYLWISLYSHVLKQLIKNLWVSSPAPYSFTFCFRISSSEQFFTSTEVYLETKLTWKKTEIKNSQILTSKPRKMVSPSKISWVE